MQCTTNIPLYYQVRGLNVGANGYVWNPYGGDANYGEEVRFNLNGQPCNTDMYIGYQKGVLRKVMQNHEATFRYQVQELHRLYKRQCELLNGMQGAQYIPQHQSQFSETNYSLPQTQYTISQNKPSWILGDCSDSKLSVLTTESIQQSPTFISQNFLEPGSSLKRENIYNEVILPPSINEGYKKRIFDLELPADFYHNDEEPEPLEKRTHFIDLNEPFETERNHSEIVHNEAGPTSVKQEYSEVTNFDFDLNSVPENCLPEEIEAESNKKFEIIDLNIDLNFSNLEIESEDGSGLEGPISPENKETTPPRGDSEETQIMETDTIAAETLMKISSHGVHECSDENVFSSLSWFAGIVSLNGYNVENELKKVQNQQTKVVARECLLALATPSLNFQTGLRKKGRRSSFVRKSKCSKLSSSNDVKNSQLGVFKGWGKVKRRWGVCRRPASKFKIFTI